MTGIHIPPAALEAGARAILREWTDLNSAEDAARAAFVAMANAWPRMTHNPAIEQYGVMQHPYLILPLTENPDAEA